MASCVEESSKSKRANRWVGACTALQLVQCKVYSVQFTGTCSALQLVQCVHRCQVYTAHLLMAWEVGASRQAPHFRSWAALHGTALHGTALYCTALHCTALHCTALHCTALHCTATHYTALHCTALHFTALHCFVLYSILR